MADRVIDYDRGVIIRLIPKLNMEVFMYVNEPGVYLSAHGKELNRAIAEEAGFDVVRYAAQRTHRERMAKASTMLADELRIGQDAGIRMVVEQQDGFKIVSIGKGRHELEDEDGNILTPGAALSLELARTVLRGMVKDAAPASPAVTPPRGRGRVVDGAVAGEVAA